MLSQGIQLRRTLYTKPWIPWYTPLGVATLYALLLYLVHVVRYTPPVLPLHPGILIGFVCGTVHCIRRLYISASMYRITLWLIVLYLLIFMHYLLKYSMRLVWAPVVVGFVTVDVGLVACLLDVPRFQLNQGDVMHVTTMVLPIGLVPQLLAILLVLVTHMQWS